MAPGPVGLQGVATGGEHGKVTADTVVEPPVPHAAVCAQLFSAGGDLEEETACLLVAVTIVTSILTAALLSNWSSACF